MFSAIKQLGVGKGPQPKPPSRKVKVEVSDKFKGIHALLAANPPSAGPAPRPRSTTASTSSRETSSPSPSSPSSSSTIPVPPAPPLALPATAQQPQQPTQQPRIHTGDLLAAIRKGTPLRKVQTVENSESQVGKIVDTPAPSKQQAVSSQYPKKNADLVAALNGVVTSKAEKRRSINDLEKPRQPVEQVSFRGSLKPARTKPVSDKKEPEKEVSPKVALQNRQQRIEEFERARQQKPTSHQEKTDFRSVLKKSSGNS